MGKRINMPVWVADDGKRFRTEQAMSVYEAAQKYDGHVSVYIDSLSFPDNMSKKAQTAQRTRIRSILLAYLGWAHQGDEVEEDAAG